MRNIHFKEELQGNLRIEVNCFDLDKNGNGLAVYKGWTLVIPMALPHEFVLVELDRIVSDKWIAELIKILIPSPDRVSPPCDIASECGGCSLQHLSYQSQVLIKRNYLYNKLEQIGINKSILLPIKVDSNFMYGYRNKAVIPVKRMPNGRLTMGYYRSRSHEIIDLNHCQILDKRLDKLIPIIKQDLENSQLHADPDLIFKDSLRHIGIRIGVRTGEILITFICGSNSIIGLYDIAKSWFNRWPNLMGVTLNIQPQRNNILFGSNTIVLQGKDFIREYFCDLHFNISSTNFFQVNINLAEYITRLICSWFQKEHNINNIVDCYCGIGTISLPLASCGFNVKGIEVNKHSVMQARKNSSLNNIQNIEFIYGDVAELLKKFIPCSQAIVLDPPRKGLSNEVINTILKHRPNKIAYLSCNHLTLTRDLRSLISTSLYKIESVHPIDFFPQTMHLECLVLISITQP